MSHPSWGEQECLASVIRKESACVCVCDIHNNKKAKKARSKKPALVLKQIEVELMAGTSDELCVITDNQ